MSLIELKIDVQTLSFLIIGHPLYSLENFGILLTYWSICNYFSTWISTPLLLVNEFCHTIFILKKICLRSHFPCLGSFRLFLVTIVCAYVSIVVCSHSTNSGNFSISKRAINSSCKTIFYTFQSLQLVVLINLRLNFLVIGNLPSVIFSNNKFLFSNILSICQWVWYLFCLFVVTVDIKNLIRQLTLFELNHQLWFVDAIGFCSSQCRSYYACLAHRIFSCHLLKLSPLRTSFGYVGERLSQSRAKTREAWLRVR